MKVAERRKAIVNLLLSAEDPVSGGELAQKFGISRQIIVQDITVLKGTGYEILSTSQGYIMQKSPLAERVFKVRHTTEQTEDELSCIVDLGGTVVDV
ncbi:MAG: transcription repressor NadR, partial [Clostridia bacterium]|nr:transcription repressor NadR [Clostridia bacterium]